LDANCSGRGGGSSRSGGTIHMTTSVSVRIPLTLALFLLTPGSARAQSLFHFHNGFWMNLHHYLHALARANEPLVEDLPSAASASERAQWAAAVEFYRTRFGRRSLLFDDNLLRVKQQLATLQSPDALGEATLTPEHRQVLERTAPLYRKHLWPQHQASNAAFIAFLQPLLERHGPAIAARLARSYADEWPAGGLPVDVVRDAGPPGNAYTTNVPAPTHITIGTQDHTLASLELMFHEASHHWDQRLMKGIADAAAAIGKRPPPDLWHAVLFFNAGRITRDVLEKSGQGYELMMVQGKIFDRPGWHAAIGRHWPLFLSSELSRDEALRRIVADLAP
jgi:hypothetical protein